MEILMNFIILFFVCVGGCVLVGKIIGSLFFGKSDRPSYIDKTTHIHHHYHDNRSVNVNGDEFKNLK